MELVLAEIALIRQETKDKIPQRVVETPRIESNEYYGIMRVLERIEKVVISSTAAPASKSATAPG